LLVFIFIVIMNSFAVYWLLVIISYIPIIIYIRLLNNKIIK